MNWDKYLSSLGIVEFFFGMIKKSSDSLHDSVSSFKNLRPAHPAATRSIIYHHCLLILQRQQHDYEYKW